MSYTLVDGERGKRWLDDDVVAKIGRQRAYSEWWTRIGWVNGKPKTCNDNGPIKGRIL